MRFIFTGRGLRRLAAATLAALLAGCSGADGPAAADTASAATARALPAPAPGNTRAGRSYDVTLTAHDGNAIAFTVHEPVELVGGAKYPLLLNGPGFGATRIASNQRELSAPAGTPLADIGLSKPYTDAGYGVISFDQRGFGDSGGTVTLMDPETDGANLLQILDWAEAQLDWLQYRDDGLMLGAYGGSYGGGYQLLLNNIDPQHRLKAIVPSITWYDLAYSLNAGDVPKSGYGLGLSAAGLESSRGQMDPALLQMLMNGLQNNRFSAEDQALLRYHSNAYFCEGVSEPGRRAATHPPQVDALFLQGMTDVVFDLNEARANADCLRAAGGDVRLFSYTMGHPLPVGSALLPVGTRAMADYHRCGPWVGDALARLWFDAKLKRDPTAVATLATAPQTCINLGASGAGIALDAIAVGGAESTVPQTFVPELVPTPLTVPLYTATEPTVVAGIPTATLTLAPPAETPGLPDGLPLGVSSSDAMVFVSIGLSRAGAGPAALEILGDQVRPLRGFGTQTVELHGIGIQLAAGDQLHLVLAGQSPLQYPLMLARNPLLPLVQVSGSVQLPVLGNVPTLE